MEKDKIINNFNDVKEEVKEEVKVFIKKSFKASNPGNRIVLQYKNRYKDGVKYLKVVGKYDLYEKIQSHKSDTDIYNIIERYLGGDISVLDSNMLQKGTSFFGDISQIPNNVNDFSNYIADLQDKFDVLPIDVKSKFGNSFMRFATSVDGGKLLDTLENDIKLNQKYQFDKYKEQMLKQQQIQQTQQVQQTQQTQNNDNGGSLNA